MLARHYEPGTIITFTYNDPDVNDKFPKVIVLNPNYQNELLAINLHYLTEAEIQSLKPLLKDIKTMSPQMFYFNKLKLWLKGKDVYRRYKLPAIRNSIMISKELL